MYVNPNLPIHPPTLLSPLVSTHLFSTPMSLFLLCRYVHLTIFMCGKMQESGLIEIIPLIGTLAL